MKDMPYIEKHSLDQIQSELGGWLAAPGSEGWLVMYCCCWPSRPFSPFVSCPTATHRSWSPQSSSEISLFTSFLNWTHRSVFQWVSTDSAVILSSLSFHTHAGSNFYSACWNPRRSICSNTMDRWYQIFTQPDFTVLIKVTKPLLQWYRPKVQI